MLLLNKRKLLDQLFCVVLNILKLNGITSACSDMIVIKVFGIEAFLSHEIKMSWYNHSLFLQTVLVKYIFGTFALSLVCFKPTYRYCNVKYHMHMNVLEYQLLRYWLPDLCH